jgi:glycerol kinase
VTQTLYLAIDQGGHASRALLFDGRGRLLARQQVNVDTRHPNHKRVEQDPEQVLDSIHSAVRAVLQASKQSTDGNIIAGLATQRSSIVCWDRQSGQALSPVISWQDRRADDWVNAYLPHNQTIHQRTGLFATAYYGASKLRWCLDHLPAVQRAREQQRLAMGPLASFLLFRLLQQRPLVADPGNAARTLLWNINSRDWDPELLELFDIPREPLPRCVPNRYEFGDLEVDQQRIPLRLLSGDQNAALFASGRPDPQNVFINAGTGAFIQSPRTKLPDASKELLRCVLYADETETLYALEGTVNGAGSALDWADTQLYMGPGYAEKHADRWLALSRNPPLFLNTVSGLGSPWWRADLLPRFIGNANDKEKIVAVIESIVFLLQVNLQNILRIPPQPRTIIITGGLSVLDGMCQRLADLSGMPVRRPPQHEATARGIACLTAGCPMEWRIAGDTDCFQPRENKALYARFEKWLQAMHQAMAGHDQ